MIILLKTFIQLHIEYSFYKKSIYRKINTIMFFLKDMEKHFLIQQMTT